ncbi:MAG: malate dehydrogenase [Myxococcota bacterium]
MQQRKIALIGGGQIGGTLALLAMQRCLGHVVLLDMAGGVAAGKALDLSQMAALSSSDVQLVGGDQPNSIADADVCIVTAGFPRKPGMDREDLLQKNLDVMRQVADHIVRYAPQAFVICLTNPLDAMVYALHKMTRLPKQQIVGMAGVLDSARFRTFLAQQLGVSRRDVTALVLGGHGDDMVPLPRFCSVGGIALPQLVQMGLLQQQQLDDIIQRTRQGGGEIVQLLGNGSAFYAPAQSALDMAEAFLMGTGRVLPCAALLEGEYGVSGLFVGVPAVLGGQGVQQVLQLPLQQEELAAFENSVQSVRRSVQQVDRLLTKQVDTVASA